MARHLDVSRRVRARGGVRTTGLALAVGLVLLVGGAHAQTLLDFVTLDSIDYIRWAEEPGRALTAADLGSEFATIACSVGEDSRACAYGMDAAAAFMPAGSRVYAVRGYPTEFRLAVTWRDRIFLYQAWRSRLARVGAHLYPLAGKVVAIDVQIGAARPPAPRHPSRVAAEADVRQLVELVLRGPVRPESPPAAGEPRYWLTFWLADGTTLDRSYAPSTGELMGGVVVPDEFRKILARYASP